MGDNGGRQAGGHPRMAFIEGMRLPVVSGRRHGDAGALLRTGALRLRRGAVMDSWASFLHDCPNLAPKRVDKV
jgi:hypothetical protein